MILVEDVHWASSIVLSYLARRDRVGELTAGARAIIAAWTEPGTLVEVTHGANILPLTGVTPEEGGTVIVKPATRR